SGSFDVTWPAPCGARLDCSAPSGTLDFAAARAFTVAGDTSGAGSALATYACTAATMTGPERVFEVDLPAAGRLVVAPTALAPGLQVFVVEGCDEGACWQAGAGGACSDVLAPGVHHLVVDGEGGAAGAFELL